MNWLIIVGREYKTRVRRRAFIISTLLGPVLMVGFIAMIVLLSKSDDVAIRSDVRMLGSSSRDLA